MSSAASPPWAQAQLDDIQQQLRDQIAVAEAWQRSELRAVNRAQKAQAAAVHAARAEAAAETVASVPSWTAAAVSAVRAEMAAAVREACAKDVAAARCEAAEEREAAPVTPYAEAVIAANGKPSPGAAPAAIGRAATATLLEQAGTVTAATGRATAAAPADRAGAATVATSGATAAEQRTVNHPAVREMVHVCLRGIVDRQNNSPLRRKASYLLDRFYE